MKKLFLSITTLGILAACSTPSSVTPVGMQSVNVNFAAEINGQAFECGKSYTKIGTTSSTIIPNDYRLYVSEIQMLRKDGVAVPLQLSQDGVWQHKNVALLDFENGKGPCSNGTTATHTNVQGNVAAGDYTGIEITVGVPFELNHGDPTVAPAPLNSTAMFWNWQGGYKFIKFDTTSTGVSPERPAAASPLGPVTRYSVHLGSTACASASRTAAATACQNPNRIKVRFDRFDVTKSTVVVDIGRILAKANVDVNAPGTSPGCMSFLKDADCPPVMAAMGLGYEGVAATGPQQLLQMR